MVEIFLAAELFVLDNALEFLLGEADEDIFGLEISMDDPADAIEEVQSHQDLPGDLLDDIDRQSLAVVLLQDLPQVDPQDFEHHAEVVAIGPLVEEGVEEVEHMAIIPIVLLLILLVLPQRGQPLGVQRILGHLLQYLNLRAGRVTSS